MWSLPDVLLYRLIETWANLAAVFEEAELYHFDIFTSKPQSVPQSKTNNPLYGAGDWSDKRINALGEVVRLCSEHSAKLWLHDIKVRKLLNIYA